MRQSECVSERESSCCICCTFLKVSCRRWWITCAWEKERRNDIVYIVGASDVLMIAFVLRAERKRERESERAWCYLYVLFLIEQRNSIWLLISIITHSHIRNAMHRNHSKHNDQLPNHSIFSFQQELVQNIIFHENILCFNSLHCKLFHKLSK